MKKSINALRMLGVTMVNKANSGHPGIVLDAAPMIYTIFSKHLRISNKHKSWINRDRFVLSAGHGSALLYATLYLSKMGYSKDNLINFRQIHHDTPGHPEYDIARGVECTTGPLGQGIGLGVGMAIAEASIAARFNKDELKIIDHYTYILCGDGDLQEGISQEAIALAGHLNLNKIIMLYDSNDVQLDSGISVNQSDNVQQRFEAVQWDYQKVVDGNDTAAIDAAICKAKQSDKPSLIEVKTIIGEGASKAGTHAVHGAPLGADIKKVEDYYKWAEADFEVPQEVWNDFENNVVERGNQDYEDWSKIMFVYTQKYPELAQTLSNSFANQYDVDGIDVNDIAPKQAEATRVSSGRILEFLQKQFPAIMGGSADLASSTKAKGLDGDFQSNHLTGRNLCYGVREFNMMEVCNGATLHGGCFIFGSTFFVFTDYLKPALRLASLMQLPNLLLMTHDSILLGEDGPTHQPIEQLAMLRSQPNVKVFRPADFWETWGAYQSALSSKKTPHVIVLTRQNVPLLKDSNDKSTLRGAYIIYGNDRNNNIIITATGSEVALAIAAAEIIEKRSNLKIKVISMPCQETFLEQNQIYQKQIYEKDNHPFCVTLELASTFGWSKYGEYNIGVDRFGESGKAEDLREFFGFNEDEVAINILHQYKNKNN